MLSVWPTASVLSDLPAKWPGLSAGGLLALVVLLILTGQLVPGRTHRREVDDLKDQVLAEREARVRWEQAALRALGQTDQLLPGVKVTRRIAESIPPALADRVEPPEEPVGRQS